MADDPTIIAGTFKSRRMLAQSEQTMGDLLASFDLLSERILNGEPVSLAEVTDMHQALARTRAQMVEEVNKHEKRVLQTRGLAGDSALDFDAIRREIGSRLDRVRAARGSEGVS